MVICLVRSADRLHMVQLMPLHPKTHNLLLHLNPDWFLPFWYQLTQVVQEKRQLNGFVVVVIRLIKIFDQYEA